MSMQIYQQIAEFGKNLTSVQDLDEVLPIISQEAKNIVNAERCSIFIVDKDSNMMWTKHSDGIGKIAISLDSGIVGHTVKTKKSQVINDPYSNPNFLSKIDEKSGFITSNILTVPIYDSKQSIIGVIQLLNKQNGDFSDSDEGVMSFFANYISGTLELVLIMNKS